jgi:transcriptional regulator with XRE-family HTH domain
MYTQQQIANQTGVSAHTVGRVERDNGLQRRPNLRGGESFDMTTVDGVKAAINYYDREARRAEVKLAEMLRQKLIEITAELDQLQTDTHDL